MSVPQEVELKMMTLGDLFSDNSGNGNKIQLKIPDYQRIYSWEEKQVMRLLNDVHQIANKPYHMGTIILHKRNNGQYEIVDGQQRLVTLTLLLLELPKENESTLITLANASFESEEAHRYIAYNKWLIQNYLKTRKIKADNLLKQLQFSVLLLCSENLDLAYTFFTANGNRGKSLSDYDLLKSHHLRFIYLPEQALHLAGRWDNLIRQSDNNNQENALARTFETCLFRSRQWMRNRTWDEDEKRKVKNHFEAALIIPEIPPFGEQFDFYETIQGGTHFFAFAEHFIERYKEFQRTIPYKQLHMRLNWEKHWWYRDVIEALLFAYFLKFGIQYLCDAFALISKNVAQHRLKTFRAYLHSILKYVSDGEIVMMIDQATSPTFFLAELKALNDAFHEPEELSGTRQLFNNHLQEIYKQLDPLMAIKHESNDRK